MNSLGVQVPEKIRIPVTRSPYGRSTRRVKHLYSPSCLHNFIVSLWVGIDENDPPQGWKWNFHQNIYETSRPLRLLPVLTSHSTQQNPTISTDNVGIYERVSFPSDTTIVTIELHQSVPVFLIGFDRAVSPTRNVKLEFDMNSSRCEL